ncbi:hypothetical protein RRG08_008332 [Elysia crispata]|uniref:Uncharacterized protein n=1 Tax=Elysia crispata TaxID=231223 RepID=A0AAE1DU67_9GAST|nr:hypothetical protein RRG08_008332 [Elysia crispata]
MGSSKSPLPRTEGLKSPATFSLEAYHYPPKKILDSPLVKTSRRIFESCTAAESIHPVAKPGLAVAASLSEASMCD